MSELRQYIEHLGVRYVPPQQALAIEIVDIDLAGQFEPWRGPAYDARVIRDVFPPRISLRYRLSEDGQVVAPDQEQVTDINYLSNAAAMRSSDPLRYEKAMLADRFRRRFVSRQSGPPLFAAGLIRGVGFPT